MLTITVKKSIQELEKYAEQWNLLALNSAQQLPMLSHAWVSSYIEYCLGDDNPWLCLLALDHSKLVGVLPLIVRNEKVFGINLQVLETPYDAHTNTGDILVVDDYCNVVLPAFINQIKNSYPNCVAIRFQRSVATSPVLKTPNHLPADVLITSKLNSYGAYLNIDSDFDTFRRGLSKNFRSNLNKAKNKLNKLPEVKFSLLRGEDAHPGYLINMVEVEAASWKGREGSAIQNSVNLIKFYSVLVDRLYKAGILEWHFLSTENNDIAANLAIKMKDSVILWKLGYNEQYSRLSPGSLLLEYLAKDLCSSKAVKEINLTTDQPWYNNWEMLRREYFDSLIIFKRLPPMLLLYFPVKAKDMLKRIPGFSKLKAVIKKLVRLKKNRKNITNRQ